MYILLGYHKLWLFCDIMNRPTYHRLLRPKAAIHITHQVQTQCKNTMNHRNKDNTYV